jgi:hypothetical protein
MEIKKNLNNVISEITNGAFNYLKSLPMNKIDKSNERMPSLKISSQTAEQFTNEFRNTTDPFKIPISWCFDKEALVKLLGITEYSHFSEVEGIRFYAAINNNQMTLVAVSTTKCQTSDCEDCQDDLTEDDNYPYYDYADPCPNNCSSVGNLKHNNIQNSQKVVIQV